jgi:5-methylcytosine-specific restriction protein A
VSPSAPGAICADCPKRATVGRYCGDHQRFNQASDNRRLSSKLRRLNDPLDPMYRTARWAALRLRVLRRDPLCCGCGHRASAVADHKIKARVWIAGHNGNEESFYDETNLQGLCKRCHDLKTRRGE